MTHLPPLYLASKSPRRQELLRSTGIPFQLIELDVEETFPSDMVVEDVPEYLARKKAEAALPLIPDDALVITADSVVLLNHKVYGKPANEDEARQMLQELSGRHHLVITGVFIGGHQKGLSFSEYTTVWMERMLKEELDYYIRHFQPYDKAGAYGIQEWIGWAKVSRIEGSYANVMGLPVQKVYETLRQWAYSR